MDLQEFRLCRGGLALSIHQINEFEEKHQLKLPPDYREIVLKQFNGGRSEDSLTKGTYYTVTTKIKKGSQEYDMTIGLRSLDSLEKLEPNFCPAYREDIEEFGTQIEVKYKKLLLIGYGEDSYFMLGIAEENFGQVFLWVGHDEEEYNPHKVADSFLDFIDKLELHNP